MCRIGCPTRATPTQRSEHRPARIDHEKSINLWAFPYPDRMSLRDCLKLAKDAGFDGIELNYDLDNDLSPKAGPAEFRAIRKMADEIGIAISGLCSFLYWPYSLTDNDPARRDRGLELARLMIAAAHELGTENLLTIAGSTYIPWIPDREPVPFDVCDRRAREAIGELLPLAEKAGVSLNIENIFFNGYLTTPDEMNAFVDSFGSRAHRRPLRYRQHHALPVPRALDSRSSASGSGTSTSRSSPRRGPTTRSTRSAPCSTAPPTGRPSWTRSTAIGYEGYLTFEYFHPFPHYPEALIYQTSDALDRIMGRKIERI